MYLSDEPLRISPRLRDALVADLMEEADEEERDWLLSDKRRRDEHECTEDLARQLGFQRTYDPVVHDLLLFVLPELERLLNQWPLPEDNKECAFIVKHATSGLGVGSTYVAVLSGPPAWSKGRLPDEATIGALPNHLESVLRKGLTSALRSVLDRWTQWNVPRLHHRWDEEWHRRRATPATSPVVLTEAQRRQRREERNRFNQVAGWVPPGRTT